jgi:hypothetical protein
MALNCRPGQVCWIDVPRDLLNLALGMNQIHGHVVRTRWIHPASPVGDPQWVVNPPQSCTVPRDVHARNASVAAGTVLKFQGVPDSYLRPFDDMPPELFEEQQRVLQELGS